MKAEIAVMTAENIDRKAIARGGEILKNGGLVAFPTETVYGLGGNALDPKASMKIYAAKGRPSDNPLIVHIADIRDLDKIVTEVPEKARVLAEKYWPGPLTMILPKADIVPKETTGGLDSVAVRFPSDPIAQELILAAGGYVAAPSANTSGRPSPTTAGHVAEDLGEAIDMIIDGGQVNIGLESTIVDFTENIPVVLRPGYISLEMLRETLGDVRMDKGLIKPDSKVHPKAPGMKYRHYAPKADLAIVEGSTEGVIAEIEKRAGEAEEKGLTVGIIATDETKGRYSHGIVKSIGSREQEETIAHHLYEVLRDFDSCNVSAIYSEAFFTPRMGQAIMNRLLKALGCDHGGYELMQEVKKHLEERGLEYKDFGCNGPESVDYPVYGKKVAQAIVDGECEKGILICGTGIGISITANKFKGIRAALCTDCFTAEATRLHNDANILAMGGRVVGPGLALKIVDTFLDTPFSGDERHIRRINMIED